MPAAWVHVTVDVPLQVQPVPLAETSDVPVGSVAVTVVAEAVCDGPALVIVMTYVPCEPAVTVAGPLAAMPRSAVALTVTEAVAALSADVGSASEPFTVAVTAIEPVVAGSTARTSATSAVVPFEPSPAAWVQVTVPDADPHDQPAPEAETNVVPAGTGTETVNPPALVIVPVLEALSVKVAFWPATAEPGAVAAAPRSTVCSTADDVAVLFEV